MNAADQSITIGPLAILIGTWRGEGHAEYPTIKAIDYTEELVFSMNRKDPILHYEQKTWIKSKDEKNGEPVFWESGFIIARGRDTCELVSAQKSGRMEILRGSAHAGQNGFLIMDLESVQILNDDRMVKSARHLAVSPALLQYQLKMATKLNLDLAVHVHATLHKI